MEGLRVNCPYYVDGDMIITGSLFRDQRQKAWEPQIPLYTKLLTVFKLTFGLLADAER